jgi:hypothetical protein
MSNSYHANESHIPKKEAPKKTVPSWLSRTRNRIHQFLQRVRRYFLRKLLSCRPPLKSDESEQVPFPKVTGEAACITQRKLHVKLISMNGLYLGGLPAILGC